MSLYLCHDLAHPSSCTDLSVEPDPEGGGFTFALTVRSTGNDSGFVKMWYQQPSAPLFTSNVARALQPTSSLPAYQVNNQAKNEPPTVVGPECRTENFQATSAVPATVRLSWAPPDPNQTAAVFFQVCDNAYPGNTSTWYPTVALNAQHS
jgi:hypothetical protein